MTTKTKALKTEPSAKVKTPAPAVAPVQPKGWTLDTAPDAPSRTRDELMAQVAANGIVSNGRFDEVGSSRRRRRRPRCA